MVNHRTPAAGAAPPGPKQLRHKAAPSAPSAPHAPYHHGDLREALLAAAEAVLLERGVEGFTLRECARRAGVSHAAPAHHFGDARGLLTEVAALGHQRKAALMGAARSAAGGDAGAALLGVGLAYVQFAFEHPAQFSLMYRHDMVDMSQPRLRFAAGCAMDHLHQALVAACEPGAALQPGFASRALLAWSAVHGFALLVLEGAIDPAGGVGGHEAGPTHLVSMLRRLLPALTAPEAMPAQPAAG